MKHPCDFSGWATKANLKCSDGRTIMKGAFEGNDGKKVPLVWNHVHNNPNNVLGHALLENREEGVYAYCYFNDSANAQTAKKAVQHGDITALSIFANELQQQGNFVVHGNIRELSLVMAGANPGAFIDSMLSHGEESEDEAIIYTGETLSMAHADGGSAKETPKSDTPKQEPKTEAPKQEEKPEPPKQETKDDETEKTVKDVYEGMTDDQKMVLHYMVGKAMEDSGEEDPDDNSNNNEGGNTTMKHNVFEKPEAKENVLSHEAQGEIIGLAKENSIGSLKLAMKIYAEEHNELKHGISDIESLFPDFKDLRPGAPELVTRDQGWVNVVINGVHKSPFSRIRTRQMDARSSDIRGHGYRKGNGNQKKPIGDMSLINRTTDPQTIYVTDSLKRDDIIDITDFDVVQYQFGVMRLALNEEVATDIMVGDGRNDSDEKKVSETHVRSIWNDNELYSIHKDIDFDAAKAELQGTNTGANFGDNFIFAEAVVSAALYAREGYKGSGTPDFFCTPHTLNRMLLARDMVGNRIYKNKEDLTSALNVRAIHTCEQFENLVRTDEDSKKHGLLGIFVNLEDYTVGSTKGGEITRFDDFDIKFNQYEYLLETRLSGALTRIKTAVVLEEPVNP